MAASEYEDRLVVLRGGLVVPAPAYLLALDLERRGFTLSREGDSTLVVRPHERLTREDCAAIRRWKWHLLMLLAYCSRPGIDSHLFSDVGVTTSPPMARTA